jgi:type 1 glutamine amidotransferase
MIRFTSFCYLLLLSSFFFACEKAEENVPAGPHIAFVMGDEEYRSEESMPMLAKILQRELNATISLCYSIDSIGNIDPNRLDHIANLEVLDSADMMVLFMRFRELPRAEARQIEKFAESGKPMAGFRTTTHAFKYKTDSTLFYLNNEWPTKVFGQQWITHHGHFDDGSETMTEVTLMTGQEDHAVLNGVSPFPAYSWLYHVDGGKWKLAGDAQPLLQGRALQSNHANNDRLDQFPLTNPVAWTKTYTGSSGKTARVFFTTLGHPYDFKDPSMRKLALNGIYWALDRAADIPAEGVNAAFVDPYEPNNSGFGEKFKKGLKPLVLTSEVTEF